MHRVTKIRNKRKKIKICGLIFFLLPAAPFFFSLPPAAPPPSSSSFPLFSPPLPFYSSSSPPSSSSPSSFLLLIFSSPPLPSFPSSSPSSPLFSFFFEREGEKSQHRVSEFVEVWRGKQCWRCVECGSLFFAFFGPSSLSV